jgi:PIN domain nuclease of toxin-antitoxin system
MRLLLDTHIFLWSVNGFSRLKPAAQQLIEGIGFRCAAAGYDANRI